MSDSEQTDRDLLVAATRALPRVTRAVERALGDVSLAEYRILSSIAEGEARATRLAQRLALGKPAISASVDSLARRGLVTKSSVEGDNRATAISLTPEGAEFFARAESLATERVATLAALVPDADAALRGLVALGDAVEMIIFAHAEATVTA